MAYLCYLFSLEWDLVVHMFKVILLLYKTPEFIKLIKLFTNIFLTFSYL